MRHLRLALPDESAPDVREDLTSDGPAARLDTAITALLHAAMHDDCPIDVHFALMGAFDTINAQRRTLRTRSV